jgi:hypothetical protein
MSRPYAASRTCLLSFCPATAPWEDLPSLSFTEEEISSRNIDPGSRAVCELENTEIKQAQQIWNVPWIWGIGNFYLASA